MSPSIRNIAHQAGIALLIIGVLAVIMWPQHYGMGLVIWGMGVVAMLLGHKTWGSKTTLIALSIAVYFAYQVIFFVNNKTEPETFLLPQDFKGEVRVLYSQFRGKPEQKEEKRIIHRIDSTGVLFSQFKFVPGFVDWQFYYEGKDGNRTPIYYKASKDERLPEGAVGIHDLDAEVFHKEPSMHFFVGTEADFKNRSPKLRARLDSLVLLQLNAITRR
ncbi:MAG: hypothetical protein JNN12_02975 [Bacteroidetes Order II. Incertae sedis bacterium]|nr:hypothetical protein [Bacteroidetes Order II. bacterium]